MPDPTSRELLVRMIPDQIQDYGVVAVDREGRIVHWNSGAERITGHSEAEAVGRPIEILFGAGEDARREAAELLRRAADGEPQTDARWLRRRDGGEFWGEASVNPLRSDAGEMVGFALVLRDLTEHKRVDDDLRRSQAMFAGILEIATDAVVCVDRSQRITFFNQGAKAIFGYDPEEVVGKPLELLIPERFRAGHRQEVEAFGRSRVPARQMGERGQIAGRRKNGEQFPAEASISKLQVDDALIFTAVLRDVSARREAEEALTRQAAELARSNAELEAFAYVASHDLQEPLRMVASYTQLLARRYASRLDEDAQEFIGYAVDGVTRMQALINDLLAYSRVGTRGAEPQPVDTGAVLRRVLDTLEPAIEEAGAEVVVPPALPTVLADPVQMGQLWQNLIANALKFHRPGVPPRVEVAARDRGDAWEFEVRDNGIGIAPEYQERIFEIFQRLHSRGEYPGTGIGLAICKKIVERHGGHIWLESTPGEGSSFFFTIPRQEPRP